MNLVLIRVRIETLLVVDRFLWPLFLKYGQSWVQHVQISIASFIDIMSVAVKLFFTTSIFIRVSVLLLLKWSVTSFHHHSLDRLLR